MDPSTTRFRGPRFQVPVVAVACLMVFLGYVLFTTGYQSLTCERLAPGSVQCESIDNYLFGLMAHPQDSFMLEDVHVESELRDRNPRGGVRFSHTITLQGAFQGQPRRFASDPFRSPLSSAAIHKQVKRFIQGDGPMMLNFQHSTQAVALGRSSLLALLLAIVAWSFWDIRWPASPPAPIDEDAV